MSPPNLVKTEWLINTWHVWILYRVATPLKSKLCVKLQLVVTDTWNFILIGKTFTTKIFQVFRLKNWKLTNAKIKVFANYFFYIIVWPIKTRMIGYNAAQCFRWLRNNKVQLYRNWRFLKLYVKFKISITAKLIELSFSGKLNICPEMAIGYFIV